MAVERPFLTDAIEAARARVSGLLERAVCDAVDLRYDLKMDSNGDPFLVRGTPILEHLRETTRKLEELEERNIRAAAMVAGRPLIVDDMERDPYLPHRDALDKYFNVEQECTK